MAETRSENRASSAQRPGGRTDVEKLQRTERETTRGGALARREPFGGLGSWRDPFSMLNDLDREMHRLFENVGFGSGFLSAPLLGREIERGWSPQIEVLERDNKVVVKADLPGLNKEDVKVEINDNILTIEGERSDERKDEKGGWSERSYGRFFRSIPLPEGVNTENANATFKNGVLEITLDAPKRQPSGRRIDIK
jgi:HSP20 family protein